MTQHDDLPHLPDDIRAALRAPVDVPDDVRRRHLAAALEAADREAESGSTTRTGGSERWRWLAAAAVVLLALGGVWSQLSRSDVRSSADAAGTVDGSRDGDTTPAGEVAPPSASADGGADAANTPTPQPAAAEGGAEGGAAADALGAFTDATAAKEAALQRLDSTEARSGAPEVAGDDAAATGFDTADTAAPSGSSVLPSTSKQTAAACPIPVGRTVLAEYTAIVDGVAVVVQLTTGADGQVIVDVVDPATCARS